MAQNPYITTPSNIMPGLQMLSQSVQRRAGFERERVKTAQEQKIRADAAQLFKTGTPEEIADYRIKHPEVSKDIEASYKFKSEQTRENKLDTLRRILIDREPPAQVLLERAEMVEKEGGNYQETLDDAKEAMVNEQGAYDKALKEYSMLASKEEWKQYQEGQGGVADKKGKPLKLTQLITKRNDLPEDSPDREIYEQAIAKEVALPGEKKSRPFISKLMADGWLPSGRITGPMLDAFEAAAAKAEELGNPLTIDKLRKMDFEATKNRKTGSTAGSRLVLARKQGIESAQGLLKDMKITSDKLKYSGIKFVGALQKHLKGQLNDPDFTEYMTQRADSLFILGNVLKQNGLTDKSIEVEEEAFSPSLAPKAFNAWLNTQIRALNRAAKEMNTDYGFGITLLPAFDPGQGGAPTEEQPVPVMPSGEGHGQSKYKEGQTANNGAAIFSGGVWRDNI